MIRFTVYGTPVPQGSMVTFNNPKTGKAVTIADNKKELTKWRKAIAATALEAWPHGVLDEPIRIDAGFYRHSSGRPSEEWDTTAPDIDKLLRALYDGLTGVILVNDARVCAGEQFKRFTAGDERVEVRVSSLARVLTPPREAAN